MAIIVYLSARSHDVDHWEAVYLSHEIVIVIVSGSNLYYTCPKAWINVVIGDNGDMTACGGLQNHVAYHVTIALIFWIDGNSRVSQHGFRACCCKFNRFISSHEAVAKIP